MGHCLYKLQTFARGKQNQAEPWWLHCLFLCQFNGGQVMLKSMFIQYHLTAIEAYYSNLTKNS